MAIEFFRVLTDPTIRNSWFLDEPIAYGQEPIDARKFTEGVSYDGPTPVSIAIYQCGNVVNFNFSAFDMPVVSRQISTIVRGLAREHVQCFPVSVGSLLDIFEILNVILRVECLDENRSEVMKWNPEDNRPNKTGKYRMVTNLQIDPLPCRGKHIFRVTGWEIALIVSGELKSALECLDNLGVVFTKVY